MIYDWKKRKGDYDESWAEYIGKWHTLNDVLYKMCADYPKHTSKAKIAAKLTIIGRTYQTGIERHLKPKRGISDAIELFYKYGAEIDCLFDLLRKNCNEPLTIEKLQKIIEVHGKFLLIVKKVTRDASSLRSFASKYMHFHCNAVPIFDSIANKVIKQRKWGYSITDARIMISKKPRGADKDYYEFCLRFFAVFNDLKESGFDVNARRLDYYLLWCSKVDP